MLGFWAVRPDAAVAQCIKIGGLPARCGVVAFALMLPRFGDRGSHSVALAPL